jgi:hypothetical protein
MSQTTFAAPPGIVVTFYNYGMPEIQVRNYGVIRYRQVVVNAWTTGWKFDAYYTGSVEGKPSPSLVGCYDSIEQAHSGLFNWNQIVVNMPVIHTQYVPQEADEDGV